jgi:ABC-type phosphate transport system substrate-binding protein
MSQIQSAPRQGGRARVAGLLALATTALAAFGPASPASADFTTGKCAGLNIAGNGASFAKGAQEVFNFNFKNNYCVGTPGQGTINAAYNANGSGAGVATMELRNNESRFAGSDDPPTPAQVALMNSGGKEEGGVVVPDGVEGNEGKAHVFPIAAGAVAPLVNFPEGCNPEAITDNNYRTITQADITSVPAKKALLRVRFPKATFEKIWAGEENTTWNAAIPGLGSQSGACDVPIIRVVRFDKSGTTFAFKDYLRTINEGRGWTTTYEAAPGGVGNREWPGAEFGTGGQCGGTAAPGKQADSTDHLTSACENGNGKLVEKLIATDGSIGYSDVATARNASPTLAVNAGAASAPTTPYWTQVQNGSNAFTEPTADETNGFKTSGGQKGANCLSTEFKNAPATSFGDWSKTSGANAPNGFGICTLTYGLAFDDNAAVFGNTPEEESKARTVKDYEESIVSVAGQAQLFGADYAPVPAELISISRAGVAEIGWNKSSSSGKEENNNNNNNGGNNNGGGGNATVSNQFTLTRKSISSQTGGATLSVKLPGAGKLDVLGTAKVGKKRITVGHVVLNAAKGGTFNVTLKPRAAAKQALQTKGKLKVSLKLTFTPNGGTAKTSTSSLMLKLKKHGKRHGSRH